MSQNDSTRALTSPRIEVPGRSDMFERRIEFEPAYDKRNPDPSKNYGIGSVRIRFVLIGPKGATQFLIGTEWYLPGIGPFPLRHTGLPLSGWDIGYHSPHPTYKGQDRMDHCDVLPQGFCYYDGSGLRADDFIPEFLAGGSKAVWDMLEAEYRAMFVKSPSRKATAG